MAVGECTGCDEDLSWVWFHSLYALCPHEYITAKVALVPPMLTFPL